MALTEFQRDVCRLLAENRIRSGESYLAGGAALNELFHAPRRSRDLDLFSRDERVDLGVLQAEISNTCADAAVVSSTDAVLRVRLGGTAVDFVRHRYAPLEPPRPGPGGIAVAGLADLAAMKLAAVAQRGVRRDFWDLRAMAEAGVSLRDAGRAYVRRFGVAEADLYDVARSLTYFEDAEKEPVLPAGLSPETWDETKAFFRTHAAELLPGV